MLNLPKRKHTRIKGYDYSQNGSYFVTICTRNHVPYFGKIPVGEGLAPPANEAIQYTKYGNIAKNELISLSSRYECVSIENFVVMPNHVHAIIVISNDIAQTVRASPAPTLSHIIGGYKSGVSRLSGFSVWQRSYHDHVIRNDVDFAEIADYITNNPLKWSLDRFFVQ